MSIEMLRNRVNDCEDSLTERKSSGGYSEVIRTIVGFANSVPEGRTGVLFIGVGNKGEIIGVENPENLTHLRCGL
jgi:predicted HTH transcriptional regulator